MAPGDRKTYESASRQAGEKGDVALYFGYVGKRSHLTPDPAIIPARSRMHERLVGNQVNRDRRMSEAATLAREDRGWAWQPVPRQVDSG